MAPRWAVCPFQTPSTPLPAIPSRPSTPRPMPILPGSSLPMCFRQMVRQAWQSMALLRSIASALFVPLASLPVPSAVAPAIVPGKAPAGAPERQIRERQRHLEKEVVATQAATASAPRAPGWLKRLPLWALSLPALLFLALPLLALILRVSLADLFAHLTQPDVAQAISLSLTTTAWAVALTLLLGTPL